MPRTFLSTQEALTYETWSSLRSRCNYPKNKDYARYGGRGIGYDPDWNSFDNFVRDMGYRPSREFTIDRIDNDGHYTKENCKWSDAKQQAQNRESSRHFYEIDGKVVHLADYCREHKLNYNMIRRRLDKGWELQRALFTPRMDKNEVAKVANKKNQQRYRRHLHKGEMRTLKEISRIEKINYGTLTDRINKQNMTLQEALSKPFNKEKA